jgi:hypothetical protein
VVVDNLTEAQRIVLSEMQDRNAEAIWFDGRWRFRDEISQDPELAEMMLTPNVLGVGPYWPL